MNTKKLIKLGAIGLALLLIPRRSSRQTALNTETKPAESNTNEQTKTTSANTTTEH